MWTLKMRLYNKENFINKLTHKYNVTLYGYPLNSFRRNGKFYVNVAGVAIGSEKDKKLFFRELKKAKQVKHIEINDDFGIICAEQPPEIEKLYSSGFIYIEPGKSSSDFYQYYYIGSWDRKALSAVFNLKVKNVKVKVLQFKEEGIKDISVTGISPSLTKKQRQAFKLAYENSYYHFPRGSELGYLSKLMKISLSTFQAHLRKAERKIMDLFYTYIK